ncbi:MAG: polysaccharide deacetylase family protein [Bacteroidales bacterium]|nr:polysaccharide deacetylase family protein [Bacteroidales bacterium]
MSGFKKANILFFLVLVILLLSAIYYGFSAWFLIIPAVIYFILLFFGSKNICSQFYIKTKCKSEDKSKIHLTFDDGPHPEITPEILKILKKYNIKASIHIGPSFEHIEVLKKEITDDYKLISYLPSLIEEFSKYDLAITGGGITPFEANASGLPCLIIANEKFEIPNGKFLDESKSSKFIGYHENIVEAIFTDLNDLDIKSMSKNGMKILNTQAVEKIYKEIKKL